jgi:hypothetical protein
MKCSALNVEVFMKGSKFALVLACAMLVTGCGGITTPPNIGAAPAPLARTQIDDRALMAADKGFDLFNDAVNLMIDRKVITPGSPRAKALAYWIRKTDIALQAAFHAAEAGHATSYATALAEAQLGITELKKLMGSN